MLAAPGCLFILANGMGGSCGFPLLFCKEISFPEASHQWKILTVWSGGGEVGYVTGGLGF